MAGATAIADVGETLVGVLRDEMEGLLDRNEIALTAPANAGSSGDLRLTLYLYNVAKNPHMQGVSAKDGDPDAAGGDAVSVDLQYLLTAHPTSGSGDETERSTDQHRVLGRAMQVMSENSILRGSRLAGSLDGSEQLQLSLGEESTNVVLDLWKTFSDDPYRPSVTYIVSPVCIETEAAASDGRVVTSDIGAYSTTTQHSDE